MKLLQHVKAIVAFSTKMKRLDEVNNHHAMLESMQLAGRIVYEHEKGQRVWGGDKTKEMPRVRKDFEVDIALPLGPTYFRRAYRMKKESFYRLYSILKKELQQEFIKSDNGALKQRRLKSVYYIDLKIRLSAAIRFLRVEIPLTSC